MSRKMTVHKIRDGITVDIATANLDTLTFGQKQAKHMIGSSSSKPTVINGIGVSNKALMCSVIAHKFVNEGLVAANSHSEKTSK